MDFKYRPSYIILVSQLKLIIGGLNVFFGVKKILVVLIAGVVVMIVLGIYSIASKPCFIKKINYIDFAAYMCMAWVIE